MNSDLIKQYLPTAKQALHANAVNAVLGVYFLMPNFSSFLLAALLAVVIFAPDAFKQGCCEGECWSVNQLFREYLAFNFTRSTQSLT